MTPEERAREHHCPLCGAFPVEVPPTFAAAFAERDREIERLKEQINHLRVQDAPTWATVNTLRAQRDALVAAIENWRKVAIRILDGETEAASEFEDAGIVLDTALAAEKEEKGPRCLLRN